VLVFYPYAFSGICSEELSDLAAVHADLAAAGVRVVAISTDTMFALRTFADQLRLPFDLLSDFWPHGEVARAYDVFDPERGCALRGTFVLDAGGRITRAVRNEISHRREMADLLGAVTNR
jgi:mycoredoxin-dependent peroxiredoxin